MIIITTVKVKVCFFVFTDNGIEFIFSIFLYINLVIMFLFVLEVSLYYRDLLLFF